MSISLVNADSCFIPLKDKSVNTVVTSPPYYQQREYDDVEPVIWPGIVFERMPGGDKVLVPSFELCEHEWVEVKKGKRRTWEEAVGSSTLQGGKTTQYIASQVGPGGAYCKNCGAWKGCLGLENTPEEYVGHLLYILREVKRVLRDDGTLWLNIGDKYENKQLLGIPWQVAFALQADGWTLRSEIVWAKGVSFCKEYAGSSKPESVNDRCSSAHEHLFMFSKNKRYYWDQEAVKEPSIDPGALRKRYEYSMFVGKKEVVGSGRPDKTPNTPGKREFNAKRNLRDVWVINSANYKGYHFAVFSPELVEPCILAGAPEGGLVLDPFCGTSTVGIVARENKRNFVGLDMSFQYLAEQSMNRLELTKLEEWDKGKKKEEEDISDLPLWGGSNAS